MGEDDVTLDHSVLYAFPGLILFLNKKGFEFALIARESMSFSVFSLLLGDCGSFNWDTSSFISPFFANDEGSYF